MSTINPPEVVGCFGYYGFGAGWYEAAHPVANSLQDWDCVSCPLAGPCWQRHVARAREHFPDLQQLAEDMERRGIRGALFQREYHRITRMSPPMVFMTAANMEDGGRVGRGFSPLHRGPATLSNPLRRLPILEESGK